MCRGVCECDGGGGRDRTLCAGVVGGSAVVLWVMSGFLCVGVAGVDYICISEGCMCGENSAVPFNDVLVFSPLYSPYLFHSSYTFPNTYLISNTFNNVLVFSSLSIYR